MSKIWWNQTSPLYSGPMLSCPISTLHDNKGKILAEGARQPACNFQEFSASTAATVSVSKSGKKKKKLYIYIYVHFFVPPLSVHVFAGKFSH